ncbi:ferrous iron transport protein B [Pelagicoccus albus]|uniref:Ferrous iron transport protein B n=1 Tax=Pelagicoccus albus TaxID=415222 RepID=A0A7X1E6W1_9BACT|nr:ferrous iron transport protein B [Pelagicoccus albus]MBC2604503.1 ferrous iron transport protein B [Pelagicoccus albus]
MSGCPPSACNTCSAKVGHLEKLGLRMEKWDHVIALAGNPNTGKSTLFNALTGLRQHTGNWPGKTISRAEGGFSYDEKAYKIVDLPGTYSLLSASQDEEVARDFILFGQPDVTVIVMDATRLERNLNLALQVLQITDRAVICLNLMDEAKAHGIEIDTRGLARDLGVPVIPCSARQKDGISSLTNEIARIASGETVCRPRQLKSDTPALKTAMAELEGLINEAFPHVNQAPWIAMRLLEGDRRMIEAISEGELDSTDGDPQTERIEEKRASAALASVSTPEQRDAILSAAARLHWEIPSNSRDKWVENIYAEAAKLSEKHCRKKGESKRSSWEHRLDRLLTSRLTGIPVMILCLAIVLWLTITGANYPSSMLASLLMDSWHPALKEFSAQIGVPFWIDGLLIDGIYLTTAWVVSVMLPPMAIFFPLFTLLEDFGYLPRVAFNLDRYFQKAGAHGKQALTMCMGLGCNAAGVIATRIIESPREKLIAILTNNFSLCNGRWPTQILIATIFIGALAPPALAGLTAAAAVLAVTLLGVAFTLITSWALSRTVLKGEASTFSLELPPYRPPNIIRTFYTSLIDRTLFVLWRAIVFAAPAGAVIWLISNVDFAGASTAIHLVNWLEPIGWALGLNGVILLAYVVAIPANEIVIPTVLMLTVQVTGVSGVGEQGAGVMFEVDGSPLSQILHAGGWTLLTAICLMLFSLCHNPCSTTIYTIYKETRSAKWTTIATAMPLAIGFILCAGVAAAWRFL